MVNVAAFYQRSDETSEHAAWSSSLATALCDDALGSYAGFLADDGEQDVGVRIRQRPSSASPR